MAYEVTDMHELKAALKTDAPEIVTHDKDLVKKLRAIKRIKAMGPGTVAAVIAAIPVVVATGPFGGAAVAFVAPSAGVATSTIVALVVAVGGTIAISLFSNWEYVEIGPGGMKMKRKAK